MAGTKPLSWIGQSGFTREGGRQLLDKNLYSWARRADVLIPGKVSGFDPWQSNIAPSLVAALPPSSWCFARWSLQLQRLVPRGAVGDAQ